MQIQLVCRVKHVIPALNLFSKRVMQQLILSAETAPYAPLVNLNARLVPDSLTQHVQHARRAVRTNLFNLYVMLQVTLGVECVVCVQLANIK